VVTTSLRMSLTSHDFPDGLRKRGVLHLPGLLRVPSATGPWITGNWQPRQPETLSRIVLSSIPSGRRRTRRPPLVHRLPTASPRPPKPSATRDARRRRLLADLLA
jgi:hypothetical protein